MGIKYKRPTWDEYFIEVMHAIAKRATCGRGRSGCVIVKDNRLLSTGYVGSPSGLPSCDDVGHLFVQQMDADNVLREHCIRTVHAEQNAICAAAKQGTCIDGATLYCTMTPCRTCAMMIINTGIKKVICDYRYINEAQATISEDLLHAANVQISYINVGSIEYEK